MPKPKPKPSALVANVAASPCDRGKEIPVLELTIRSSDPLVLFFQVCAGVGQLASHLGNVATGAQTPIAEAMGVGEKGVQINVPTSSLTPGRYVLTWTFRIDSNDNWTTAHELSIREATMFRLYKGKASSRPVNTLFMSLVVLA